MMSWCKANAWRTLLVWMTIATLVQPQWLLAVEANPQSIRHRMEVPRDVVLTEDGVLTGHLINLQAKSLAESTITLQSAGKVVARVKTDREGNFRVNKLRGGVYSVVANGHQGVYRLWAPQTAPPAARQTMTLVSQPEVVRGQFTPPPSNPFSTVGQFIAEYPVITASAVVAAIAIPLALDDDDVVAPPATP